MLTVGNGVVVRGVGVLVDGEGAAVAVLVGDVFVGDVLVAGVGAAVTGARTVVACTGVLGWAVEKAVEVSGAAAGACVAASAVDVSGAGVVAVGGVPSCAGVVAGTGVVAVGGVPSCVGVVVALGVLGVGVGGVATAVAGGGAVVLWGEVGGAEVARMDPATIRPAIPTAVAAGISIQRRRGR